jgi:hypothetical protein
MLTACDKSCEARIVQNAGLRDAHLAVCSAEVFGIFFDPVNAGRQVPF